MTEQFNSANNVENNNNEKRNFIIDERIYEMRVDENSKSRKKIENSQIEKINENVNNERRDYIYSYQ